MITKTYYLENTDKANERINKIIDNFMCFVETKIIVNALVIKSFDFV